MVAGNGRRRERAVDGAADFRSRVSGASSGTQETVQSVRREPGDKTRKEARYQRHCHKRQGRQSRPQRLPATIRRGRRPQCSDGAAHECPARADGAGRDDERQIDSLSGQQTIEDEATAEPRGWAQARERQAADRQRQHAKRRSPDRTPHYPWRNMFGVNSVGDFSTGCP